MSLQTNIVALAQRTANESKALRLLINGNRGDLAQLTTSAKTSLVAAINELQAEVIQTANAALAINDSTVSAGAVWSSEKVTNMLSSLKADILGPGATAALDTLKELGDAIVANGGSLEGVMAALAKRVRVDIAQGLTPEEQTQARQNIGAVSTVDVGDTTHNFVTTFETALAS